MFDEVACRNLEIITREDARAIDLLGSRLLVRAGADATGGAFCLLEMEVPAGGGVPLHYHPYPEVFHMIWGRLEFLRIENGAEEWIAALPGETIFVPPNVRHALRNCDHSSARLLVVVNEEHLKFFEEAGVVADPNLPPVSPSEQDLSRVLRIAAKYEMFLG